MFHIVQYGIVAVEIDALGTVIVLSQNSGSLHLLLVIAADVEQHMVI